MNVYSLGDGEIVAAGDGYMRLLPLREVHTRWVSTAVRTVRRRRDDVALADLDYVLFWSLVHYVGGRKSINECGGVIAAFEAYESMLPSPVREYGVADAAAIGLVESDDDM